MKKRRILLLFLAFLIFCLASCAKEKDEENAPENTEEASETGPYLTVSLSDGRSFVFETDELSDIEVLLPARHPSVPEVGAVCLDGNASIGIAQAFLPVGKDEAYAVLTLASSGGSKEIRINFKKDKAEGFVLQYDDRYRFVPKYDLDEGGEYFFAFENETDTLSVDPDTGVITVTGIGSTPEVLNAYVDGMLVDSLTVTETVRAPVDIYVVTGQGNAAGIGGSVREAPKFQQGQAYYSEAGISEMLDLSEGREGMTSAFAQEMFMHTGRKMFILHAGATGTSVTEWKQGGPMFERICSSLTPFTSYFGSGDSGYSLGRGVVIWMQGELDVQTEMTEDEYIGAFSSMFDGLKDEYGFELCGIIPVRSGNADGSVSKIEAAQYSLGAHRRDVCVLTRLPGKASVENGFLNSDGLYFTQYGYNEIGYEAAETLYCFFAPDAEKRVAEVNLFTTVGGDAEEKLIIKAGTELSAIVVAEPLWAVFDGISISTEGRAAVSDTFGISVPDDFGDGEIAKIRISAGGAEREISIIGINEKTNSGLSFDAKWEFGESLETASEDYPLKLSASSKRYVSYGQGAVLDGKTDFVISAPLTVNTEKSWYIEWNGSIDNSGILAGGNGSSTGYILLAPFSERFGNSVRIVSDEGSVLYLPYGEFAEMNRTPHIWRISCDAEKMTLRLEADGVTVSECEAGPFELTLTNLFGRYQSEESPYCLAGVVAYVALRKD